MMRAAVLAVLLVPAAVIGLDPPLVMAGSHLTEGAFVTTWNDTASPYTISIPVEVHTGGTLTIDWGDTTTTTVDINGTQSHTYSASGEYHVSMTGDLSRIILGNLGSTSSNLASIDQWGDIEWSSMKDAFPYTYNMKYNASDVPNLSGVSSMENMFKRALKFDGDLSEWNVSAVTDMHDVFTHASSFNGDVSTWNVSAVTTMEAMFNGASVFNGDISSWNVSAVTNMRDMFDSASVFNGDLSGWDVSAVTNMDGMFDAATSFDQNLGKWYVVPADTDYNAATETTLVVTAIAAQNFVLDGHIPNYGIGTGGNSALFNMTGSNLMFKDTTPPAQVYKVNVTAPGGDFGTNNHRMLDITVEGRDDSTVSAGAFLTTWNVAASQYTISIPVEVHTDGTLTIDWGDNAITPVATNGTQSHTYSASDEYQVSMTGDLSRIILGATGGTPSKLASIDQWGYIEWSSMEGAFRGASNMEYKAADAPDLSYVTSMQNMFRDASSFNGDLSGWDVSAVTNMNRMFAAASSFNGDLSGWNVSAVTNMNSMFVVASSFNGDLSGWNVSAVTNMNSMFVVASVFNGDLSGWDVSAVTNMDGMFDAATSFDQNLGKWYVVPADTDYNAATETTLVVTAIAAQNFVLDGHIPNYGIGTGGNSALFNMTGSNLMFKDTTPPAQVYKVNVTAPGGDFGTNNHRMLDITVEGRDDSTVSAGAFLTTWNVAASQYTISIPVEVHTDGTLTIDWGDNAITPVATNGTQSHTYSASDEYQVSMTGDLSRIILGATGGTPSKLASIDQWGYIEWSSMEGAFRGASNMEYKAADAPDLSYVTSMQNMFRDASSFNGDLSGWGRLCRD